MPSSPALQASRRAQRLGVLLLAPLVSLPALADWRYVARDDSTTTLQIQHVQFAPDHSLWSFSSDGVRRTDIQGNTQLVRRSDNLGRVPTERITGGVLLDDGGAILSTETLPGFTGCGVQRIDAQLRSTWRIAGDPQDYACSPVFANAAGMAWLERGDSLRALERDGSLGASAQAGSSGERNSFGRSGIVLADGGIIVNSYPVDRFNTITGARLNRFARDGSQVWSWLHASPASVEHLLPLGSDVIGALNDYGDGSATAVKRWNTGGEVVWSLPTPANTPKVVGLVAAAGNDTYVLAGPARAMGNTSISKVQRVSADGQIRWQRDVSCIRYFERIGATLDASDGVALICDAGETRRAQLLRLDRDGAVTTPQPLPLLDAAQILRQPDGRLLVLGNDTDGDFRTRSLVVDGNSSTPAPIDALRTHPSLRLGASHIAADGTSYVAVEVAYASGETPRAILRKLDAQGNLLWSHTLQNTYSVDPIAGLAHNAGRICALAAKPAAESISHSAVCLDANNGNLLWQTAMADAASPIGHALRVLNDGSVVAVVSAGARHEVRRFTAAGGVLPATRNNEMAFQAVIDANGRATVVTSLEVIQYALDGSVNYRLGGAALALEFGGAIGTIAPQAAFAGDDGSVWLTGPARDPAHLQRTVWAIAPDGSTRWLSSVSNRRRTAMTVSADALYIAHWDLSDANYGSVAVEPNYLTKLDKASGAVQWNYTSIDPIQHTDVPSEAFANGSPAIALSADYSQLLLLHSWTDRLRLQRIDPANGQRQHERFVACTPSCAAPRQLAADNGGTLRTSFGVFDAAAGVSAAVLALDHAAGPMPRIRLDQAGIGGAWWSPYANGEGIAFDWLPASRTVFAAWFTYANTEGNDTAGLRWYTLQANGATTLELPILKTDGGSFAAGPGVSPRRVGTAGLQFHDCSNGTLYYAFDPGQNDGRSGTITLSRLSPPTQACLLADGSSQPADGARPPLDGFDARMSGSWYEEATTGQGLQLTVQPGAVFFAPWFTFDPADGGNDQGRQHWFTLQGNLATASNASVELQLVQTTGGVFDRIPTYNANPVGSATLRMQGCDRAQLDYRFHADATAGPFQARSGRLNLVKAGGCTP